MKVKLGFIALIALAVSHPLAGRDIPGRKQTSISLEFDNQDTIPTEASHITVPPGEIVSMNGHFASFAPFTAVQWLKNGQPIQDERGADFALGIATAADSGTYAARLTLTSGATVLSQALVLNVAPTERLINMSVLNSLPAGLGQGLVAGFVVSGTAPKKMIVRAVGPSLAQFGLAQLLRQPRLVIRDSSGRPYENGYVYPAVNGALSYESDLAESLAKVGAFSTPMGNADAVRLLPIVPGNYTLEVTSADSTGGTVLLELYEVP